MVQVIENFYRNGSNDSTYLATSIERTIYQQRGGGSPWGDRSKFRGVEDEGWRRGAWKKGSGRKRGREESKGENREGTRYPPDFMAPRRRSLKVRYRQDDDVESCLVPVSIINTMKNNREKKKGREKKGDQRNVWYLVKKILCFFNNFFLSIHSITSIVGL